MGLARDAKETWSFLRQFETDMIEAIIKKDQVVDAFSARNACLRRHTSHVSKRPNAPLTEIPLFERFGSVHCWPINYKPTTWFQSATYIYTLWNSLGSNILL